jgi:predicted dehydrogenase
MTLAERPFLVVTSDSNALRNALEVALEIRGPNGNLIPIGLVGCGWIGGLQLEAYAAHGFNVVALFDRKPERASRYRDRFFPQAEVHQSLESLIAHPGLKVVDVATHLEGRPETILRCLTGGLNVLSQKPFTNDLAVGKALSRAARTRNVAIAVNQNGRWAPHFAAMLAAVRAGTIGDVVSADFSVAWPHDLVVESKPAFAEMKDLVLFDFGTHWFDLVGVLAPLVPLVVHAVTLTRPGQTIAAPLQASVVISGEGFISTLDFRAGERFEETGQYRVSGTRGVVTHTGKSLGGDTVTVYSTDASATVSTAEDWFLHGLAGAMRELLVCVEAGKAPAHNPESAMRGLSIAFAALESARSGRPVDVGSVQTRDG